MLLYHNLIYTSSLYKYRFYCIIYKTPITSKEELYLVTELISTCFLIFIAEMGDKSQLLTMSFATRYTPIQVLLGVFIASLLNHSIAIYLGFYLSKSFSLTLLQLIAAFCFIIFGLLSFKSDNHESNKEISCLKCGPIFTVALTFFIGELGDKTQLTSMTLATQGNHPLCILFGAVFGMLVTSIFAIWIGYKITDIISSSILNIISSYVFIIFGMFKLWSLVYNYIPKPWPLILFIGLSLIIIIHTYRIILTINDNIHI